MSDITDLNPLSPTGNDPVSDGDNELRALKNALVGDGTAAEGSFTPSFTGQYTGTATDLNLISTAIQPTDRLNSLSDVAYGEVPSANPSDGDYLIYSSEGNHWLPRTPPDEFPPLSGSARYSGYAGILTNQIYFTNEDSNTISTALATIKNDNTGGFGWTLTAAEDVVVTLNLAAKFAVRFTSSAGIGSSTVETQLGIGLDTVGSSFDNSVGRDITYSSRGLDLEASGLDTYRGLTASTSIVLSDNDYLTVSYLATGGGTFPQYASSTCEDATLNVSVTQVSV